MGCVLRLLRRLRRRRVEPWVNRPCLPVSHSYAEWWWVCVSEGIRQLYPSVGMSPEPDFRTREVCLHVGGERVERVCGWMACRCVAVAAEMFEVGLWEGVVCRDVGSVAGGSGED